MRPMNGPMSQELLSYTYSSFPQGHGSSFCTHPLPSIRTPNLSISYIKKKKAHYCFCNNPSMWTGCCQCPGVAIVNVGRLHTMGFHLTSPGCAKRTDLLYVCHQSFLVRGFLRKSNTVQAWAQQVHYFTRFDWDVTKLLPKKRNQYLQSILI